MAEHPSTDLVAQLLKPDSYPHPTADVQLIETHMSWVFLTGTDAYKIKKPVCFDFADFSAVARRKFFCEEELRCNRRFAPELYLEVRPVLQASDGSIHLKEPAHDDQVVDWAVHMRQFPQAMQADRLLEAGELERTTLGDFGRELARAHDTLPVVEATDQAAPVLANFATLRSTSSWKEHAASLGNLEARTRQDLRAAASLLRDRLERGFVRECHGDLHLSNLVCMAEGLKAFDCLEFDASLRQIDVICDAAFLFMDCAVRDRNDLAYAFIDGYTGANGDYRGLSLLGLFARYRSMVRAKVAALRLEQSPRDATARHKLEHHVGWAIAHGDRPVGRLIITCGLSGSGKSYWAERLVPEFGAIRLRSDVLRKTAAGLAVHANSDSQVGTGLYTPEHSADTYESLADLSKTLLKQGETVVVDAAALQREQRQTLYAAAQAAQAPHMLLYLNAPEATLRHRIVKRAQEGSDPSEADLDVLSWQLENFDTPTASETVLAVDTETLELSDLVARLDAALSAKGLSGS